MEALRVQHATYGGKAGLIVRADSPVGGASGNRAIAGRARLDRPAPPCTPFPAAATPALPDASGPAGPSGFTPDAEVMDSRWSATGTHLRVFAQVNAAAIAAPEMLAVADYVKAAEYAARVEELSRTVEYLQILAAGAVDRTRIQAMNDAARRTRGGGSWVTGWDNGTEILNETDAAWPAATAPDQPAQPVPASPADDGCRNTAEFLRVRLRIGISEARRRLALARDVLSATTLSGGTVPPAREHLAAGLTPTIETETADADTSGGAGTGVATVSGSAVTGTAEPSAPAASSRAGTIISVTLDRLQHLTTAETLVRIERDLTRTAATADPDFLARVARRWSDAIDADGSEPTEETLGHTQGAFIRKPRHGLHHLEIFATTDQYEHLLTVMNTATNPRTAPGTSGIGADLDLDRRTRAQKQLDGIIGAVKAALTTGVLPITGGNRPQIIATINYQDLFPYRDGTPSDRAVPTGASPAAGGRTGTGTGTGTGNFGFTGPVAAATLRKIACDADIIPALLGTNGEILDLGRRTRLFTPAQRLALTARDQGCAFPNCTIPAPWCEAHHVTYWSHDGPTDVANGALLCSHHHHLVHKEHWTILIRQGIPWFVPPRHIDPRQEPRQNHYFKPPPHPRE